MKLTINIPVSTTEIIENGNNSQLIVIKKCFKLFQEHNLDVNNLINFGYVIGLKSPFTNEFPREIQSTMDGFEIVCVFNIEKSFSEN